jgi:L-threonylcarbamoyladenylate synthase
VPAAAAPEQFAHELYARLRQLDDAALNRILVLAPPATPSWTAVNDRLARAAAAQPLRAADP